MRLPGWQMKVYCDNLSWPWKAARCFSSLMFKNLSNLLPKWESLRVSIYSEAVKLKLKFLASVVGKIHGTGQKNHPPPLSFLDNAVSASFSGLLLPILHYLLPVVLLSESPASFQYPTGIIFHQHYTLPTRLQALFKWKRDKNLFPTKTPFS